METMRLQKYLARAGVGSRRACENYIVEGRVAINGRIAAELGTCVVPGVDAVSFDGSEVLIARENVTLMLHKPAGYVTTMRDPQGRACVADLVPIGSYPSLFPVGRLDRDTTGLLLFTTDGELGNALIHPRFHVWKRYVALVEGIPTEAELQKLRDGVLVGDSRTQPAELFVLEGDDRCVALAAIGDDEWASGMLQRHTGKRSRHSLSRSCSVVEVRICEGRNRQVRKMLSSIGHEVISLHRCSVAGLSLGDLARGTWRTLSDCEISELKNAAGV